VRTRSGTVSQSGLRYDEGDYEHERMSSPVLGIVLAVYASDDALNRSSNFFQDGRGSQIEARVLVINDGSDSPWILPNVAVLPRGASGVDNYSEEIPRGVSGATDDAQIVSNLTDVSPSKLDGDWCVVDFLGGSYSQPFMSAWWPHPANRHDPATAGTTDALAQGRRWARRFQGTRAVVTSNGTVLLDTSEANHLIRKGKRGISSEGGDVRITIKDSRTLEMNWNASVFGDPNEVDFLWETDTQKHRDRATTNTHIAITKDQVEAVAGQLIHLKAKDDGTGTATVTADHVNLGGASAPEQLVLGTTFKGVDDILSEAFKTWADIVTSTVSADPLIPPPLILALQAATTAFKAVVDTYKNTTVLSDVSKTR
jgi:hypothetical protein